MIKQCEKCNAFYNTKLYESCPVCSKSLSDVDITKRLRTPSDLDIPVLVMCPPVIQKIYVDNNPFMEEQESSEKKDFDFDKLMQQWLIVYQTLASRYLVLTLPPNPLLQDLTWTNQAAYLPHVDEPTCVISNFRAEGRQPESDIMEWFLQEMGYKTYRIPDPNWYWEGEPCLKFLRDNIYIGSYGMRTTEEALNWIAEKFDAKIIKVGIETEHNYHGDTIFCPISPTKVMIVIPFSDKKGLRELEKYAEIIPIEDQNLGKFCITNNVVIGYTIYAGTYIEELEPNTEEWEIEMKKIETLEMISAENGMDLVLFDISTFDDFGAALSCTVMRLNYPDRKSIDKWENYGKK